MNNIGEKFLPIGTVVMLKGGSKRLMITGFCTTDIEDPSIMYDYAGCMYPEGFLSSDQTALFNHDQIVQIYHVGLVDEEENEFKEQLKSVIKNMNIPETPAPSPVQAQPVSTTPAYTFAPDGTVISATPAVPVAAAPTTSNIKFDENGVVISA